MEEVQRVRLYDLAIMQEAAEPFRRRRQRAKAGDEVHRLGRRDEMAHRTDAAEALHRNGHLPVRSALDEDLEAAELDDMEPDLMNPVLRVEEDRHLAMPLDTGDRLDGDPTQLLRR